jgi:hypothetical protein
MIFRCTARFMQSFDSLDRSSQTLAIKAIEGFKDTPRIPSALAHVVKEDEGFDVWTLPCGSGLHITFSFIDENEQPDHYICVLRNVGREEMG